MTDTSDRLKHIYDAILKIKLYVKKGRSKFDHEEEIRLSIIYYIQIVGEAASSLPQDFRASHLEIPWRAMISMRNRLIHHYDGIDLDVVWETATVSIPALESRIAALLSLKD